MKTQYLPLFLALTAPAFQSHAQIASRQPLPPEFAVVERGPHHRIIERVVREVSPTGRETMRTNRYTELATGMHYWNAGWHETVEEIRIVADGGLADRGPHRLWVAGNVNSVPAVELETPDQRVFRTRVLGIAYYDPVTGQSELIGELRDSIGQLISQNQVIYRDCFDGMTADVRMTYTKAGFEQDVILRKRPEPPQAYGLSERSRIQVWTELFNPPTPTKHTQVLRQEQDPASRAAMVEPDFKDELLDFGAMRMNLGKAFSIQNDLGGESGVDVVIGKELLRVQGRDFLIESAEYESLEPLLDELPLAQRAARKRNTQTSSRSELVAAFRPTQLRRTDQVRIARATARREHGVVFDYALVSSSTNFVFRNDTTYYVGGNVNLSQTTTIEGLTVVKYTNSTANNRINILGPLRCITSLGRPAIFTSMHDDTVGEMIAGSTGNPTNTCGQYHLAFNSSGTTFDLHDIRSRYAQTAIFLFNGTLNLSHSQIGFATTALLTSNSRQLDIRNVLFHDLTTGFNTGGNTFTQRCEHITMHRVGTFANGSSYRVTNSLLIAVTNGVNFTGASVVTNQNDAGFFQTVGAGSHYLPASSSHRYSGTTNISPSLLAALRQRTTQPPLVLTNHITNATTLGPFAQRASASLPDLGYFYDPLDYVVNQIDVSAALTIKPGTAIGVYGRSGPGFGQHGSYGLKILQGGSVVCEGTAINPSRFLRYNLVQEQATSAWATNSCGYTLWTPDDVAENRPSARFRFTQFSMPAGGGEHFWLGYYADPPLVFVDCELGSGRLYIDYPGIALTNCVLDRVASLFRGSVGDFHNNLFHGGSAEFAPYGPSAYGVSNNVLDKTTISQIETGAAVGNDYNGYITNSTSQCLTNGGSHNTFTNSFVYESGALGRFYQPTNSLFLGAGSTNASLIGLYHFTVLTNNVKETNSIVDLGFHYISAPNGVPSDQDGDGFIDYLEDADGDGVLNSGEPNFLVADTDGDGVSDYLEWLQGRNPRAGAVNDTNGVINLRVYTPLK